MVKRPTQTDTTPSGSDLPTEAHQHLEQAYAYNEIGEFENALRECELAVQLAPDWADAHNLRGIVLEELGRKEAAITAYRQAVRLDPTFREARENLFEAESELEERIEAAEAVRGGTRWVREKTTASRVYWWLLLSPFVTVPCFVIQIFDLYGHSTVGERTWAAVVPLIFHVPLLLMSFGTDNCFVRRHMQQALLLIGVRAGWAIISLNLSRYPEDGLCWFLLGNGALWLFGSIGGLRQVGRGDCWLMRWRGENDGLPRPWAVPMDVVAIPVTDSPAPAPTTVTERMEPAKTKPEVKLATVLETTDIPVQATPPPAAHSPPKTPSDPNAVFEKGLSLLRTDQQAEAADYFLAAFRAGSPDLRNRALAELEKLGEVEIF